LANDFDLPINPLSGSTVEVKADDASSITGTEKVLIVQSGTVKETTTQDIADLGGGTGYLSYVATLTQTATNAPVATELENTLGGTVAWSYVTTGIYRATGTGLFTVGKTVVFLGNSNNSTNVVSFYYIDGDEIDISCIGLDGTYADGQFVDTSIEIRVYP
jgi:hypothetical protein